MTEENSKPTTTRPKGNLAPDIEFDADGNPIGKKIEYKRVVERLHYFAVDGNYGDAAGLTVIDTTDWTSKDFDLVEEASDSDRPEVARLVSDWVESGRNDETIKEHLKTFGVEVSLEG